jgi:hypothetical protein
LRKSLDKDSEWKSMSMWEKYETFTDVCNVIWNALANELEESQSPHNWEYTALDGQDFLYIVWTHQSKNKQLEKYIKLFKDNRNEWKAESDYESTYNQYHFFQDFFTQENLEEIEKIWYENWWNDEDLKSNTNNPARWEIQKIWNNLFCFERNALARSNAFWKRPNHTLRQYISIFKLIANKEITLNQLIKEYFTWDFQLKFLKNAFFEIVWYVRVEESYLQPKIHNFYKLLDLKKPAKWKDLWENYLNTCKIIDEITNAYGDSITDLPKHLEVDKFLAYLYAKHSKDIEIQRQYWLIAPGANAMHWDLFQNEWIIGIW